MAPAYFKDTPAYNPSFNHVGTVKRCVPFLEALSFGFIIPLWTDYTFTFSKSGTSVDSDKSLNLDKPTFHPEWQFPNHGIDGDKAPVEAIKLATPWIIKTDPGVSCLFTQPFNHFDLGIEILSGVIDTDQYYEFLTFPFFWRRGYGTFTLKKGTPLVQVIPFKREALKFEIADIDKPNLRDVRLKLKNDDKDVYRNTFWHKSKSD